MTAVIIAAIVMTMVGTLFTSISGATDAEQADAAVMQSTSDALYRIQRDVRQSDPDGVFACTGQTSNLVCTPASELTQPTDIAYLAVLTDRAGGDGTAQWDSTGRPAWTGFEVYWLAPTATTGIYDLGYGFAPANIAPGANPSILNEDVIGAVSAASGGSDPDIIAHSIEQIETMVDVAKDLVAIRITSQTAVGTKTNSLSVQSDAYARN